MFTEASFTHGSLGIMVPIERLMPLCASSDQRRLPCLTLLCCTSRTTLVAVAVERQEMELAVVYGKELCEVVLPSCTRRVDRHAYTKDSLLTRILVHFIIPIILTGTPHPRSSTNRSLSPVQPLAESPCRNDHVPEADPKRCRKKPTYLYAYLSRWD